MAENNHCHDTSNSIKVTGLQQLLQENLTMHFQSSKNNGGDVKNVHVFPDCDKDSVLIEFEDPKDVESVLKQKHHKLEVDLEIERHSSCSNLKPTGDSSTKLESCKNGLLNNPTAVMSKKQKEKLKEILNSDEDIMVWEMLVNVLDLPVGKEARIQQGQETKKTGDDVISLNLFLFRYIYNFHWNEIQELENVCKEIKHEIKPGERVLHLTAKDDSKEQFNKALDQFISLYQKLSQKMHQEVIPSKSKTPSASPDLEDTIRGARRTFPVIISNSEKDDGYLVYGEKDVVEKVMEFIENCSGVSPVNPTSVPGNGRSSKPLSYNIAGRTKLLVCEGDLTEEVVDVIVNPANCRLDHGGGAAGAIVKKGGKEIQRDSDEIVRKYGKIPTGRVAYTKPGSLPCKFIIHAVGPVWDNRCQPECREHLGNACFESLAVACKLGAETIAIPAISSGIYNVPLDVCAEVLFSAVEHFCNSRQNSEPTLREIRFLNNKKETVDAFEREMMKRYGSKVTRESGDRSKGSHTAPTGRKAEQTSFPGFQAMPGHAERTGGTQMQRNPSTLLAMSNGHKAESDKKAEDEDCVICLERIKDPKVLDKCKHKFCKNCIDECFKHRKVCPICSTVYGINTGNQPDGQMNTHNVSWGLPGYDNSGTIIIEYSFKSGTQGKNHPNPGQRYSGAQRTAYLPNTKEGRKVLALLRKAFNQRLTFTVGTSATTNFSNQIIWNDIHHKTNVRGGPTNYGYPDYDYLKRVQEELKSKGIE